MRLLMVKTAITFIENGVQGSLSNPIVFANNGEYFQDLSFNAGWTWISMNLDDVDFQDINQLTETMTLATSDRITSSAPNENFVELYYLDPANPNNSGWSGSISANGGLNSDQMFKVFTANEQPLTIEGVPVDIELWSFDVALGWNWFPYPFSSNHSVNESLSLLEPMDGDIIKSQTQFAIFDPLNGWSGSLTTLKGGKGYMLKAALAQTFTYPNYLNRAPILGDNSVNFERDQVVENFATFSGNMNGIIQLPEGYNELYIYDSLGNIKGFAYTQSIDDRSLAFVTIYGETTEKLKFFVSDGKEMQPTTRDFEFKNNGVMGTLKEPIVLELFENGIKLYPNPFEDDLTLDFNVSEAQTITVQLFSLTNQLLLTKEISVDEGLNSYQLKTELATGVYYLHIAMKNRTIVEKIIRK